MTWNGVSSGSFPAPDHEYPSYLQMRLTATDADGLTKTVTRDLMPKTIGLTLASNIGGVSLGLDAAVVSAPTTTTEIAKSTHSISAPTSVSYGGGTHPFSSWSDSGAATHSVTTGSSAVTYTATYGNTLPTAGALSPTTLEDTPKSITLTGSDANGDTLGFTVLSSPTKGTLGTLGTPSCSGSPSSCTAAVTYTPSLNLNGSDSFTYRVADAFGNSTTATRQYLDHPGQRSTDGPRRQRTHTPERRTDPDPGSRQ